MALKVRAVKVSDDMWERWQAAAKALDISAAALIIKRMESGFERQALLEHQATRMGELEVERDAARMTVTSLEGRIVELESYTHSMVQTLDAKSAEVAELKKALAAAPKLIGYAHTAPQAGVIQAIRSDPANRIIDPKVHHVSGPVLADTVPIVEGNAVGFNLKGQTKGKGKS